MKSRYVYSLNGADYVGAFDTRQAAERTAIAAARRSSIPPATVFVARAIPMDAGAGGHAGAVLANMSARARQDGRDANGQYLGHLTSRQVEDLDAALETVILAWLDRHHLTPACFHVEAIGEHPVPTAAQNHTVDKRECENHVFASADEVFDLGID